MKKAGDLCKIDNLGRIVIPSRLRKQYDLKSNDTLEIFTDSESIILKKYIPTCIFCGEEDELVDFESKYVCKECISKLSNAE